MFSHAEQNNDGERSVIVVGLQCVICIQGIIKIWFTSDDFAKWEDPVDLPTMFITVSHVLCYNITESSGKPMHQPQPFPNTLDV